MKPAPTKGQVNWIPLPDAITEAQVNLKLTWSADIRTRLSIVRQARLMGCNHKCL